MGEGEAVMAKIPRFERSIINQPPTRKPKVERVARQVLGNPLGILGVAARKYVQVGGFLERRYKTTCHRGPGDPDYGL